MTLVLVALMSPVYGQGVVLDDSGFQGRMEELRVPRYREVSVLVTAYSIGDDNTPGTIMASGKRCYVGAVAYNDAELGTKVIIDGVEYTVEDRMMHSGYIDIYMDNRSEALDWGVQRKTVRVEE